MNDPVYVDTNVFMDFFLNRDSSAYLFFEKAFSCKYKIIISDAVIREFCNYCKRSELENFICIARAMDKIEVIVSTKEDHIEANALRHITHYADALHKVLAKRRNVVYFVTKNVKDFREFRDIVIKTPDEL